MNPNLDEIILRIGEHTTRTQGVCLLEAVAWFAGEKHTDHPTCVSPVIGAYGRGINDALPEEKRQSLKSLIPAMIGTRGDGFDSERVYLAIDWIIRVYLPTWFDLAGMTSQASDLRELKQIVDHSMILVAKPSIAAAGDAAKAAAGAAAGDAAGAAAGAAAWAAARDALQPAVEFLQDSAIDLFHRMIAIGTRDGG